MSFAHRPLHERAAVLFYEGEPYLPDDFLYQLQGMGESSQRLLEYFERHIEGIKQPGFSASGRLVELFCGDDETLNQEAERAAELIMKKRIELFNSIYETVNQIAPARPRPQLKLVQNKDRNAESAS